MLIDFFYTLRSAKLPVSVKEYLTLVEALKEGVVGPNSDDGYKIDDFYYLSRTALVKDEKHYDKFDRAFAAYFKGVEMVADFTKDVPLDWLRKNSAPCLILLDLMMPVMNGWDFLRERAKDPVIAAIPVVVLSASHAQTTEVSATLTKPVSLQDLVSTVSRYC